MTTPALPTLSSSGVLYNPSLILDKQMGYFLASNQNQSDIFSKDVASLKYIVHKFSNMPSRFREELINALNKMLSRLFSSVDVTVELNDTTVEAVVRKISIAIKVVDYENNVGEFARDMNVEDYN